MIKKQVGRLSIILMVLILSMFSVMPAYAGWEQGITSVPAGNREPAKTEDSVTFPAYRDEVIRLINVEREKCGLDALKGLKVLHNLSDIRASEAAVSFSHSRPDGTSCSTVFSQNNIPYSAIGENLAYGYHEPADLVQAWMNSKLHRENMLSEKFVYVGVGAFSNDKGIRYHALLLYTPKAP